MIQTSTQWMILIFLILLAGAAMPKTMESMADMAGCQAALGTELSDKKKERICKAKLNRSIVRSDDDRCIKSTGPDGHCDLSDSAELGLGGDLGAPPRPPASVLTLENTAATFGGLTASSRNYRVDKRDGDLVIQKKNGDVWSDECTIDISSSLKCEMSPQRVTSGSYTSSVSKTTSTSYLLTLNGVKKDTHRTRTECIRINYVMGVPFCAQNGSFESASSQTFPWD